MNAIRPGAILAGLIADLVGSFIAWLLILTVWGSVMLNQGMTSSELELLLQNPGRLGSLLFVLGGSSVLVDGVAAYLTARMAPGLEYWHVLLLVILLVVLHLTLQASSETRVSALPGDTDMEAFRLTVTLLGIAAAFVGAWWAKRRVNGPRED